MIRRASYFCLGLLVGMMATSLILAVIDKPVSVTLIGSGWSVSTFSEHGNPVWFYASHPGSNGASADVRMEGWVHWTIRPSP